MEAIHLLTKVVYFSSVSIINFTNIGFKNSDASFNISTEFPINGKVFLSLRSLYSWCNVVGYVPLFSCDHFMQNVWPCVNTSYRNQFASRNEGLLIVKICAIFLLRKFVLKKHFSECLHCIAVCLVLHKWSLKLLDDCSKGGSNWSIFYSLKWQLNNVRVLTRTSP